VPSFAAEYAIDRITFPSLERSCGRPSSVLSCAGSSAFPAFPRLCALVQSRETIMLEYDQNLPQEIGHKPSRVTYGLQVLALALAACLLVYALVILLPIVSHYRV
jgi:hypothetical protein